MSGPGEHWFDDAAGPLARPYTVTGGRTRSANYPLDLITLVVAMSPPDTPTVFETEHRRILRLCRQPISVAEVGARMDLPLPVVKVLLSDLIEQQHLIFREAEPPSQAPDQHLLQAVLDGIRKL